MIKIWSRITMVMGAGMALFPLLHVWKMYSLKSSAGRPCPALRPCFRSPTHPRLLGMAPGVALAEQSPGRKKLDNILLALIETSRLSSTDVRVQEVTDN